MLINISFRSFRLETENAMSDAIRKLIKLIRALRHNRPHVINIFFPFISALNRICPAPNALNLDFDVMREWSAITS